MDSFEQKEVLLLADEPKKLIADMGITGRGGLQAVPVTDGDFAEYDFSGRLVRVSAFLAWLYGLHNLVEMPCTPIGHCGIPRVCPLTDERIADFSLKPRM